MPKTALIVDDSTSLRQMVAFTMKEAGFDVIEGENGQEALDKSDGKNFDLVITDLNMPVMDGLTLLANLNEKYPLLKSVIVSAYGDMANIRAALNRGAFDFVTKPIDFSDLEATIAKTIRHVEGVRDARRRQAEAEQIIHNDPLVQALMAQYKTARIVPGSIKPH